MAQADNTAQEARISTPLAFEGISVVECGQGVAAAFAAKLLAMLGANVIKVEPPEGDFIRRRGPFFNDVPDPEMSGLFLYLNADKRGVTLDLTRAEDRAQLANLLAAADILLHNVPPAERTALELDSATLCQAHPQLIVAGISAFGDYGPRAHYRAYELTMAHASGMPSTGPGTSPFPDLPPLKFGGPQAEFQAAIYTAFSVMSAYFHRLNRGSGQAIEVSAQEALAAMLEGAVVHYSYTGKTSSRLGRYSYGPRVVLPCADGWILFNLAEERQWQSLVELMGNPEWAREEIFKNRQLRGAHDDALTPLLSEWTKTWKKRDLYLAAHEKRIPVSPVNRASEVFEEVQLRARNLFAALPLPRGDSRGIEMPTLPFKSTGMGFKLGNPAPRLGEHNRTILSGAAGAQSARGDAVKSIPEKSDAGPLSGVRVLDFTWVWAGPFCTMQLAHLGADVIRIESSKRPCVMRTLPPFADGKFGINRSGMFNQNSQGKRSIALNFSKPQAIQIARELARHCDLAVENFAAGVIDRMGLGYEDLRQYRPDMIMISMAGYGRTGPESSFLNYGPQLAAQSGLLSVTGYPDDQPREACVALSDPASGLFSTFLLMASLVHRARTGRGQYIDLSMLEMLELYLPEALLDYAMNRRDSVPIGNHDRLMSPHNCYKALGDAEKWVTIAIGSEDEWRTLCQVMEKPSMAGDPRFRNAALRKQNEDELDRIITAWTSKRDRWETTELLQRAGVAAVPTFNSRDVVEDVHLRERGFIHELEHPEVGRRIHSGIPWKMSATACRVRKPAPLLGADTDEVLGTLLGYSSDKIASLRTAEILV
jgi:crotonobetainyl-CoA:carnitine CoA-transferase CaiB-like acyl-CoA transferase